MSGVVCSTLSSSTEAVDFRRLVPTFYPPRGAGQKVTCKERANIGHAVVDRTTRADRTCPDGQTGRREQMLVSGRRGDARYSRELSLAPLWHAPWTLQHFTAYAAGTLRRRGSI